MWGQNETTHTHIRFVEPTVKVHRHPPSVLVLSIGPRFPNQFGFADSQEIRPNNKKKKKNKLTDRRGCYHLSRALLFSQPEELCVFLVYVVTSTPRSSDFSLSLCVSLYVTQIHETEPPGNPPTVIQTNKTTPLSPRSL
jgi:hypothetical protein